MVLLKYVPRAYAHIMVSFIKMHVPESTTVYSDQATVHRQLHKTYTHDSVNHALSVYVEGDVNTNTIENFWSILKRGIYGIYHQVSDKNISRYLDEFAARFNTRDLKPQERFNGFLDDAESVLDYKRLTS